MKRALSILLLLVMLTTTYVPSLAFAMEETQLLTYLTDLGDTQDENTQTKDDSATVTRIEWLQSLVDAFALTVDAGAMIDNYYSDLDETSEYYDTVMTAVYHGLIDMLPNDALRLEDEATREFAAHTLNACMGYLVDGEDYTYAERENVSYDRDIQVAIDREWLALADGAFLPEQPITVAEMKVMLADAADYVQSMTLDGEHENLYTFYEDVIVLNGAAEIIENEQGFEITIQNCETPVAVGNKFVVFQHGLAIPYLALEVAKEGSDTVIIGQALDFDQAIESMDVQTSMSALPTNFYAAEDTELIFVEEHTGEVYRSASAAMRAMRANSWAIIVPKFSKKIPLGEAISLTLNVELKNTTLNTDTEIGKKSYCNVWLDTDAEISGTLSCDLTKVFGDGIEVYVGGYTVPGVGGLGLYFKIDMTGSISVVQKYHMKVGVKVGYDFKKNKTIKDLYFKLKEQGSSLNAEISAKIYLEAKFGLYGEGLPVEGYLYGEVGFAAKIKYTTYEEIAGNCVHFAAYLYAEYGAKLEWGFLGAKDSLTWSKDYFDESNSPVKISFHYEDGKQIAACTRTGLTGSTTGSPSAIGDSGYTTGGNSRYSTSGLRSAGSSTGHSAGQPIVLYTYTLDDRKQATITSYNGNASTLTIPLYLDGYPVVAIGNRAFQNKLGLTTVIMQENVVSIGDRAFSGCRNLRNVTFSESLTLIRDHAFEACTSLTTAVLPDSVTSIEYDAFRECTSLQYVKLPKSLTHLGSRAFYNCDGLKSIEIPSTLQSGGDYYDGAFSGCDNLKNVTFADGTVRIADYLFKYCPGIETITLPDSVTEIGSYAFASAINLKQINVSKKLELINDYAFERCYALSAITLPDTLTTIGNHAFADCTSLASIAIPDSVTVIEYDAFRECSALASVELSANLLRLESRAFYNCDALTAIEIPAKLEIGGDYYEGAFAACDNLKDVTFAKGITYIAENLFRECTGIETITIPDTVTEIGSSAFVGAVNLKTIILSSNLLVVNDYVFENCYALSSVTLPDALTTIGNHAFSGCESLESIDIPDSVTEIQYDAFRDCIKLSQVKLSANLLRLEARAFYNCDALTAIEIPAKLEIGGDYYEGAFAACDNLKEVTFAKGVTYIAEHLFKDCPGIESITIPDTVTEIGSAVFSGAVNLNEINFSANLIKIGEYVFENCYALSSVTFPDSLNIIGNHAFANCVSLTSVEFPDSVTRIEYDAFRECESLSQIKLSANLTHLGENAFYNCDAITEIEIPANIQDCGSYYNSAFSACDNLKIVTFAEGIKYIPKYMFKNCPGIEFIVIPDTVTEIDERAFENAANLKEIVLPQNLVTLGSYAFESCASLTSMSLPDTLTKIGYNVFSRCTALTDVKWSASLMEVPSNTFNGCIALTSFVIPEGVTIIRDNAFSGCTALVSVEIPATVETIQHNAFNNCDSLVSVTLPYGVKTVEYRAFYDCDALTTVKMDNSVTTLGNDVFNSCDALVDVTLSLGLTKIPSAAFANCASLETIVIPYFVTSIENNAFNASPKLSKVVTHEKLAFIANNAFSYPNKTVFCGKTGSYTETWANNNGYTFTENTTAATSVILRENTVTLAKGKSAKLSLAIDPADFADSIVFKSSNTNVVTVDENGNIKAVGVGTATVKIVVGKASASCKITVTQAITRISISRTRLNLNVPETHQLTVTIYPEDASNKTLIWTSSNENVATVDENGLVTAIGNGSATITAVTTDGSNFTVSCTVTVIDPNNIPVTSITLSQSSLTMSALDVMQLVATIAPADAANKNIVWTSSDESVAIVDDNGVVTAIAKGTVTITATAADGYGAVATCTVTVTNTAHVVTDFNELESPHPYEDACKDIWMYVAEGAQSLLVTFDENTYMEDGFDFLHVYDAQGTLIGTYTGSELAGVTLELNGNTVKIRMDADDSSGEWGFKVASIEMITCKHTYDAFTMAPGCTEQGYTTYTCSQCGDTYTDDYTEPVGHIEVSNVVDPTCTENGSKTVFCAICKTELSHDIIPANGHSMGEWYPKVPATCTEDGLGLRDCENCDYMEKCVLENLGHDTVLHQAQEPTCTESGHNAYETCTRCDYTTYTSIPATGHTFVDGACVDCGEPDCIYGDCNGDGIVNGKDVTRLLRYLAYVDPVTGNSETQVANGADANGDGIINGKDVTRLLRYLAYVDPVTGESTIVLGPNN